MQDRVPTKPNRALIRPEDGGSAFYATITRADEPTQVGDPLNKNTFLKDETAALFGLDPAATPNDVFAWLGEWGQTNWKLLAEYNTAGAYTFTVPDDVDELGVFVLGGGGSGGAVGENSRDGTSACAFGGFSGQLVQKKLKKADGDFVAGESISLIVGAGGQSVTNGLGESGGTSSFKGITASGGAGGKINVISVGESNPYRNPVDMYTPDHQISDFAGFDSFPAPYGLTGFLFENADHNLDFYPMRPNATAYNGRNIFDENDRHIYCGAGGGSGQSVVVREKGSAGVGREFSGVGSETKYGGNATAPGDGGGGIAAPGFPVVSGAGADGLVLVYGRKAV